VAAVRALTPAGTFAAALAHLLELLHLLGRQNRLELGAKLLLVGAQSIAVTGAVPAGLCGEERSELRLLFGREVECAGHALDAPVGTLSSAFFALGFEGGALLGRQHVQDGLVQLGAFGLPGLALGPGGIGLLLDEGFDALALLGREIDGAGEAIGDAVGRGRSAALGLGRNGEREREREQQERREGSHGTEEVGVEEAHRLSVCL
jgi:hypothetical protein